jgi:pimeloyl-ACP methyl ester carboxylesterase
MALVPQINRVVSEGDEIYYEVRGEGQPLLLIPGGGGDGWWYTPVAELLSDEYKVITYDRRANARSTMNFPQNFEISQQSRDAVAVLHAAGERSACIFGNSSGAVISLDLAKSHPQAIKAVIVHEPPLATVHPNAKKWQRFFASVYLTAFQLGSGMAALRFALGVGLPLRASINGSKELKLHIEKHNEIRMSNNDTSDVLIKQELLPVTNYAPDIEAINKNGVKVFMANGKISVDKKRFFAETAPILAEKLGCEMISFPGHHISFFDMPNEWAATLRSVLHKVFQEQGSG